MSLTQNQRAVLRVVRRHGPVTATDAARFLPIQPKTIGNHCRLLEKRGLVRRRSRYDGMPGGPPDEWMVMPRGLAALDRGGVQ